MLISINGILLIKKNEGKENVVLNDVILTKVKVNYIDEVDIKDRDSNNWRGYAIRLGVVYVYK